MRGSLVLRASELELTRAAHARQAIPQQCAQSGGRRGAQPVDLAHLRRYTLGDRGLELEILGLFVDQLPITIGALKNAPTEKEWGMAAHTLKGSARAVGAWPLATLAEGAERLHGLPDADARARASSAASRRPPARRAHTSPRWPAPT